MIDFFKRYWWLFLICVLFCSCASGQQEETSEISILNWNLETFFDAQTDGTEYTEFKGAKSKWSQAKYEARLKRLADTLKTIDADVVVMEELEKKEQLYDIFNMLSGSFDLAKSYKYGSFATSPGAAIGCAVISRFPLANIQAHEIHIEGEEQMPSMRPIMQMDVCVDGKSLALFVNHWKSKSGGAEKSEIWRNAQEENLSRLMKKALAENGSAIATGDFNRDISEFQRVDGGGTIRLRGQDALLVQSPWFSPDVGETGSYYYNDHWERIDHFFSCGNASISSFAPQTSGNWADSEGKPRRYTVYNGEGYSDHLPILCRVQF